MYPTAKTRSFLTFPRLSCVAATAVALLMAGCAGASKQSSGKTVDALPDDPNALVLNLHMTANASGDCANLRVDDQSFNGSDRWTALHNYVASVVGEGSLAASAEVKIHADYDLK